MTAEIIKFDKRRHYDPSLRTFKLTIGALALAIDYFSRLEGEVNEEFCKEARSCMRTLGPDNKLKVSKGVHDMVMGHLPVQKAIDTCLLS